jgi:hypothetical protein
MHSPFEILKKRPEGSFCRFEAVNDLASANIRIKSCLHYPRVSTLCLTNAHTMSLLSVDQVSGSMPEGSEGFRE